MCEIVRISAREILDSRANPTVEAEVLLSDGSVGAASVPSGASTGENEAHELRDNDKKRYGGKGVLSAVENVNEKIHTALVGMSAYDIEEANSVMIALDGTYNKSNLGANAILATSLALARAGAMSQGVPLYRYLGGALVKKMPIPMLNIINGGAHSKNNIDIQEFMIIPTGAESFAEAMRMSSEIYHSLSDTLTERGLSTGVGDEGGFAPMLSGDSEAIELILLAVERSGYRAGEEVFIGLDVASSEWYRDGKYYLPKRKITYTSDELIGYLEALTQKYPIMSIEDGVGEKDIEGWKRLTERLGKKCLLVGDDLFVTDAERVKSGIREGYANAVLIKPNQIGSLVETAEAVKVAKSGGYKTIMSHRSGETEDTFIADLAVALSADFIKTGAPTRAERTAKYNRLMKIESELFSIF